MGTRRPPASSGFAGAAGVRRGPTESDGHDHGKSICSLPTCLRHDPRAADLERLEPVNRPNGCKCPTAFGDRKGTIANTRCGSERTSLDRLRSTTHLYTPPRRRSCRDPAAGGARPGPRRRRSERTRSCMRWPRRRVASSPAPESGWQVDEDRGLGASSGSRRNVGLAGRCAAAGPALPIHLIMRPAARDAAA